MSARGEAHETGCGSSHNAAARQLCESSPAGRAAVLVKSSESDGVAYDALHQQRVMRAPEDPGGKGARPYISMTGCYNLVENSGFRTLNGISHTDDDGRQPPTKVPLQEVCVGAALYQQGAPTADRPEVVSRLGGHLDLGPGTQSRIACGGGSVVHQYGAADTKGPCSLSVNCVQDALHQQSARSANDQEGASWIDGHPDLGPGTQSRLACGGGSVVHQHGAADTKGPCSLSVNCVQGALHQQSARSA